MLRIRAETQTFERGHLSACDDGSELKAGGRGLWSRTLRRPWPNGTGVFKGLCETGPAGTGKTMNWIQLL